MNFLLYVIAFGCIKALNLEPPKEISNGDETLNWGIGLLSSLPLSARAWACLILLPVFPDSPTLSFSFSRTSAVRSLDVS